MRAPSIPQAHASDASRLACSFSSSAAAVRGADGGWREDADAEERRWEWQRRRASKALLSMLIRAGRVPFTLRRLRTCLPRDGKGGIELLLLLEETSQLDASKSANLVCRPAPLHTKKHTNRVYTKTPAHLSGTRCNSMDAWRGSGWWRGMLAVCFLSVFALRSAANRRVCFTGGGTTHTRGWMPAGGRGEKSREG